VGVEFGQLENCEDRDTIHPMSAGGHHISLLTYSIKEMVYGTVSILCIVAGMFHNGNIITDRYSVLHMLQVC
jgi:hypothetical protein